MSHPVEIDPILLSKVSKPARYVGGEWNSVVKDHDAVKLTVAYCFPDVYEVAMSHLACASSMRSSMNGPMWQPNGSTRWPDMEEVMRSQGYPLFSLETKTPVRDFDMVGFTLQYEMSFTNILNMLDLAGIPLFAKDRGDDMPLVAAGGPCAYNAEPLTDYIDVFFLGESEESTQSWPIRSSLERAGKPGGKKGLLKQLSQQPGNYVRPSMKPSTMQRATSRA